MSLFLVSRGAGREENNIKAILPRFMNANYIAVTLTGIKESDADMIVALLSDAGFEGFEEIEQTMKAYVDKENWKEEEVASVAKQFSVHYSYEEMPPQNWNAVWESNFEPVVIDDFVAIRAGFHEPILNVEHEIVITPKMSFGTGHHATTTMMMQQMRNLDFSGKRVFDFGTGTGILAILAEKLGAEEVLAVDNDEWSINNSKENVERNHCRNIKIELADTAAVNDSFDVILANINRNIILENLSLLNDQLNENGYLLLSGLLTEDEAIILRATKQYPLAHQNTQQIGQWISLLFSR